MYLSRLVLNPLNRQVRQELARPYEMHRTILHAFPDNLAAGEERVLFRVDVNPRTGALHLLVQSRLRPDWAYLSKEQPARPYLVEIDGNPSVKSVDLSVRAGQTLAFRLFANPTKRLGKAQGKACGKRVAIYGAEAQEGWLQRKAEQSGFTVLSSFTSSPNRFEDPVTKITLDGVRFDGVLQVVEPQAFMAAVEQGVGSGKAFGFGLLSVATVGK